MKCPQSYPKGTLLLDMVYKINAEELESLGGTVTYKWNDMCQAKRA